MKEEQLSNGVKSFKYDRRCLSLTEEEIENFVNLIEKMKNSLERQTGDK